MIGKKIIGAFILICSLIFSTDSAHSADKVKDTISEKKFSAAKNTDFEFRENTAFRMTDRGSKTMIYAIPEPLIDGYNRSRAVYYARDFRTKSKKYHRTKYKELQPNRKYKQKYSDSFAAPEVDTHSAIAKVIGGGYDLLDHRGDVITSFPNAKSFDVITNHISEEIDGFQPQNKLAIFKLDMDGQDMFQIARLVDNPGIVSPQLANIEIERKIAYIPLDNGDVWPYKPDGQLAGDDPFIVGFEPEHGGGFISKYVYDDGSKRYGLIHRLGAKVTGPEFTSLAPIVSNKVDGKFIGQTVEGDWQVWGVDVVSAYDPSADLQGLISVSASKAEALSQLREAEALYEMKRRQSQNEINARIRAREAQWAADRRAAYKAYLKRKTEREERQRNRNRVFCEGTYEKAANKTYSASTPLLRASMYCDDFLNAEQIAELVTAGNNEKAINAQYTQPVQSYGSENSSSSQSNGYAAINAQWSKYWQQRNDYNSGKSAYNPDKR